MSKLRCEYRRPSTLETICLLYQKVNQNTQYTLCTQNPAKAGSYVDILYWRVTTKLTLFCTHTYILYKVLIITQDVVVFSKI
jgi:hypothetical protein